jgi:hypothetical protein
MASQTFDYVPLHNYTTVFDDGGAVIKRAFRRERDYNKAIYY